LVSPVVVIAGAPTEPAENVATPVAPKVVNAPVDAVVAPTVPLMLIEAVPVKFVTTPLEGVPRAGVTKVGLVANTLLPEPVLVTETTFLLASSARAVEAVRPDKVVVPVTVTLVNEAAPPVLLTFTKSEPFHAQIADSPATIVTPVVGPAPTNLTEKPPVVALITV